MNKCVLSASGSGHPVVCWLLTAAEMKRCDSNTSEIFGVPSVVLMERAALSCVDVIVSRQKKLEEQAGQLGLHPKRRVLIAAGGGNNGADGIAIGRLLLQEGYDVSFYLASGEEKASELLKLQLHAAKAYGAVICDTIPDGEYDIIVDALFGIGLCRPAEGIYREAIEWINAQDAFVLAVDLPSGIETDTGAVLGCAVRADVTVTFGFWKRGLLFYPGCNYTGKVICTQIGITEDGFLDQTPEAFTFTAPVAELLPARPEDGNKGTFGKVLLLAGSEAMAGADSVRSECVLCRKRHGKAFLPDIDTSGDSDGASGGNDRRFCGSIRQMGGCDRRRSRAILI